MRHLLTLLVLVSSVLAVPYVGFPFDEQLPTIARQDTYYQFQLNNETFVSDTGVVTFAINDLPAWLSFDPATRTLSGTPSSADIANPLTFTLQGSDDTGIISRAYQLIVTADPGPELTSEDVLFQELSTFGYTNGWNGLVLQSGQQFTLNFSTSTFDVPENSNSEIVAYYGRSADRTSLPSWIKFNEETVSFYGTAPAVNSRIAPSVEFGFALIATDYSNYAGAIGTFNIIVGAHELSTGISEAVTLNGTTGQHINYTIAFEDIFLDGNPIAPSNISSYELNGNPDWITLNGDSISGTIPSDGSDENATFNFTLTDVYANSIYIKFDVSVLTSLFTVDNIPEVNATRGEFFSYSLMDSMFTDLNETEIDATFQGDDTDWIQFHNDNLTFNGMVPDDLEDLTVEITATKTDSSDLTKRADQSDTLNFEIVGVDFQMTTSSSSSSSSSSRSSSSRSSSSRSSSSSRRSSTSSSTASSSTSSSSNTADAQITDPALHNNSTSPNNRRTLAIALGVAIPVVVIIAAALLIFFCCFKRRKNSSSEDSDAEKSPAAISGPILGNPANNPNHNDTSTMNSYDSEDSPRRLSTLNMLKLDEKEYGDNSSEASSTTNVEGDDERSIYQDAMQTQSTDHLVYPGTRNEVPRRSWRRPTPRDSVTSVDTVATEELFTVRPVDEDNIKRQSAISMFYPGAANRDSTSFGSATSSILTRDSTANFQRLDSDGNVVSLTAPYSDTRLSSRVMSNLHVVQEEDHMDQHYNTTMDDTEYLSAVNDFSNSNSSQNIASTVSSTSIQDEFRPRETSNGDLKWDHFNESSGNNTTLPGIQTASSSRYNSTMTIENHSNSTILLGPSGFPPQPQRQASTASARARLVEFENQGKARNFDPIMDHEVESDGSESAEISFAN